MILATGAILAGDTSYRESLLIKRTPDGVSPRAGVVIDTMDRILGLADSRPLVYLPTHDPECVDRLTEKRTLGESLMPTLGGGARARIQEHHPHRPSCR